MVVEDAGDADALSTKIEAAAQAAFDEETADWPAAKKKKWNIYLPFADEEDDDGNSTGATEFSFKQNAKIKLKDGSTKDIKIELFNGKGKSVLVPVFGGTIGKIMFSMRPITMTGLKQIGVRLDFFSAQIIKPAAARPKGGGFSTEDDGWDSEMDNETSSQAPQDNADEEQGDY